MSVIKRGNEVLTLINVFTVEPANQGRLIELLTEATESTMRRMPGFISAKIHRSLDGRKVVNYAQWRCQADFDAMKRDPKAIPHMEAAATIAKFDSILCEVSETISADATQQ